MTEIKLPPLPKPFTELYQSLTPVIYDGWADQMKAYAKEAIALNAIPTGMEAPAAEAVAWLIEHPNQAPGGGIAWVCSTSREGGSEHLQWTRDPNEAIRFATKKQAELMAQAFRWPNDCIVITEHQWTS